MIPLSQAHKILLAIGLVRADNEAQRLAARILYDPLVAARINEFIFSGAGAAPEALAALHPLEKSALLDRLRIAVAPAARRGTATWVVRKNKFTARPEVYVSCAACNQSMTFIPNPAAWTAPAESGGGHLPKDFSFCHCGKMEQMPEKILYDEYPAALKGPSDVDLAYEYVVLKDTNKQIVLQQERQDRELAKRLAGANDPQVAPKPTKFID